jgi:N-acetylglucosaminyldiphosphoundecaprenol N-acetyl-beta-D-mannosaminyltransferase
MNSVIHRKQSYNFIGTDVQALTYTTFFNYIDRWIADKQTRSHHIAIINAFCAIEAFRNRRLAKIYERADLTGPDGRPFVYWLKWILKRPCYQFDASSMISNLAERASEVGYSFYLYGGHPDVVQRMKAKLETLYPHINIVGFYSPPFRKLTPEEDQRICDEINRLRPDIICVGLGTPKQDYWIHAHIYKIKGAVFIPCGAVFDFFGGRVKRAPKIITLLCLEWLYRLIGRDFKRLWFRYTALNIYFLWFFFLQLLGSRHSMQRELN